MLAKFQPILAQITDTAKMIDHAAQQNGQWFLVVAVVSMGIAIAWMARAFQMRHDKLAARLDEVQDQHTKFLEEKQGEMVSALKENATALQQFAHALSPITRILEGQSKHAPNLP